MRGIIMSNEDIQAMIKAEEELKQKLKETG